LLGNFDRRLLQSCNRQRSQVGSLVDTQQARIDRAAVWKDNLDRSGAVTEQVRTGDDQCLLSVNVDQRAAAQRAAGSLSVDDADDGRANAGRKCGRID
jgi:hypothetical protein